MSSGRLVRIDVSVIAPRHLQGVQLQLQVLLDGAHPGVADQPSHAGLPFLLHLRLI